MTNPRTLASFSYRVAMPYEPGVARRDPSPVIRVGDRYFVWYSRSLIDSSGYSATIFWATSTDGLVWRECGEALGRGGKGAWDEHAVFTPSILVTPTHFFLFYTGVPEPFDNDNGGSRATPTAIGIAWAENPHGPWHRCGREPVLRPGRNDAFDSHRVDDACLIVRNGHYWLYYKGRAADSSPLETKMGLAIADQPAGPYVKPSRNPLIDGGHEVCVFPHGSGVAALVSPVGPAGATLQYAADGFYFQKVCGLKPPAAPGPYREDHYRDGVAPGIRWGLCHQADPGQTPRPYLLRFDVH